MSEKSSYSQLALPAIVSSIAGVIVILAGFEAIGLTLIFIAALLIAGTFVRNRLMSIGAETWALGSVIVWIGFFLTALPLLAEAWGILSNSNQVISLVIGLILIVLGFTTEFFDLNKKFLVMLQNAQLRLSKAWIVIKYKILRTVYAKIQFVFSTLLILSFIFPSVTNTLSNQLPDTIWLNPRIIIVYLMVIVFLFQIHELLTVVFDSISRITLYVVRGIFQRIYRLPSLFRRMWELFISFIQDVLDRISSMLGFLWNNTQITGFTGFVVFGGFAFIRHDKTSFAIAILLLLGALAVLLKRNPEFVNRQLNRVQQSTYQRSLWLRSRIRSEKIVSCPNCGTSVQSHINTCPNCSHELPVCTVCRMRISGGSMVLECSLCHQQAHEDHLLGWFKYGGHVPACPHCREPWVFG